MRDRIQRHKTKGKARMIGDIYFSILLFGLLSIMFGILFSGCAFVAPEPPAVTDEDVLPVVVVPNMRADYPPAMTNEDLSAAIVSTLQQYKFSVAIDDPELGIVETDWRVATTVAEKFANMVVSGVPWGNRGVQEYMEQMKLTFTVDPIEYAITIQPHKQTRSRDIDWRYADLDDGDILLIHNIVTVIVSSMDGPVASLRWVDPKDPPPEQGDTPEQVQRPKKPPKEEEVETSATKEAIKLSLYIVLVAAIIAIIAPLGR
ncbi:hypothetical protein ACFL6S_21310 [Candidatus Poribacteria bacterium]